MNGNDPGVFTNGSIATFASDAPYGLVDHGAVAVEAGRIAWVGPAGALPEAYARWAVEDLGGRLVTPALVDCHTHLVFGGHRAREFEMRLTGASLAASYGALSADHLEYLDPDDAPVLAAAGTVAVLLPGAFYFLRETRLPPVEALRAAGVPMAIATDCNPGSSPLASLLLAVNMACTVFRLTAEEALAGVTREAARALGLGDECGTIEAGKRADLAVWDVATPAELAYRIGFNPLIRRLRGAPPARQGDLL